MEGNYQTPMNTIGMGDVSFDNVTFNVHKRNRRKLKPLRQYVKESSLAYTVSQLHKIFNNPTLD